MKYTLRAIGDVRIFDIEGKIILGDGDVEIKQETLKMAATGLKKIYFKPGEGSLY